MTREFLRMLSQYAVDYPTFPVNRRFFPPYRDPGGMQSHSVGLLSRTDKPPDIWDTRGISGNVFVNPPASSSSPYPGGLNPWISNVTEDTSPHVTSDPDASQDRQPEIHSTLRREVFQRIMEQTNKDCRSRNFTLTNSYTNNICLLEDKIQN